MTRIQTQEWQQINMYRKTYVAMCIAYGTIASPKLFQLCTAPAQRATIVSPRNYTFLTLRRRGHFW